MRWLLPLFLLSAVGASARDLDYGLYMRGPVGTNASGGKEIQLVNPGSRGNEFRLGNETAYSEMYFNAHLLKNPAKTDPYFDSVITLSYNPGMNAQYSDSTPTGDYVSVVEFYLKGGNFDEVQLGYWAGKALLPRRRRVHGRLLLLRRHERQRRRASRT